MVDIEPPILALAQPVTVTLPAGIGMANADSTGQQLATASAPGVWIVVGRMAATTSCECRECACWCWRAASARPTGWRRGAARRRQVKDLVQVGPGEVVESLRQDDEIELARWPVPGKGALLDHDVGVGGCALCSRLHGGRGDVAAQQALAARR
jgi:hypothetical protein